MRTPTPAGNAAGSPGFYPSKPPLFCLLTPAAHLRRNRVCRGSRGCPKTSAHRARGRLHQHAALRPAPLKGSADSYHAQHTGEGRWGHCEDLEPQEERGCSWDTAGIFFASEKEAGPGLSKGAQLSPTRVGRRHFELSSIKDVTISTSRNKIMWRPPKSNDVLCS